MVPAGLIRAAQRLLLAAVLCACGGGSASTMPGSNATAQAPASPQRDPGTSRNDSQGVAQVWVPGGVFRMGSEEGSATGPPWAAPGFKSEHPAHEVAITRGYWIDVTEVTVAEFAAFKVAGGYDERSVWSDDGWA